MKIFLASQGFISLRKKGVTTKRVIDEKNHFLDNLKNYINDYGLFVLVCNNPDDYERNDKSAALLSQAFERQLHKFKEVAVIDNRNADKAKEYLSMADFVFLCGGKLQCQIDFLKKINFKENINKDAVIVGASAGAMNLCEVGYNYPEDVSELGNEKWIKGLGYCDKVIIPHFKRFKGNMYCPKKINLLRKYYLPDSCSHEMFALKNGSYILLDGNGVTLYGKAYMIKNGKVKKICDKEKTLKLN